MKVNIEDYKNIALNAAYQRIMTDNPEAVAVVLVELDCGCMKVCGASANGEPVGPNIMISGVPATKNEFFICSKCIKDNGSSNRFIGHGIIWKKKNGKKQNEKHRNAIFQNAFGYDAPEYEPVDI